MKFAALFTLSVLMNFAALSQEPQPTPPPISEQVIVTANRAETRIGDTPASVVTFSRREIETSAAPVIDDILRQAAGFSIFRRSSSRNANPTTQGVSLRGVGSSGASRSVVMFDGVPLNDPFGGWIQWNRVAPIEIETVEVMRGGASALYGDSGLSGAINLFPRRPEGKYSFAADAFGGTQKTASGSALFGFAAKDWAGTLTASNFQTRGFIPVEETARGPVDSFAGTRSSTFSGRIERQLGANTSIFVRPSYFGEVRSNGTGLQTNRTHIRQLVMGGMAKFGTDRTSQFSWRAFGGTQVYDQIFSAVNAVRTAENITRLQRSPAQNFGFSAQFSTVLKQHTIVGGIDGRNVRGASDEIGYSNSIPTSLVGSGGRQTVVGAFVQDLFKVGTRLVFVGGVRVDRWENYRAFSTTRTLSSGLTATNIFPDRDETAFSPRAAMLFHIDDRFSLYASASRSFRSPTLNELYRGFRVGNVVTLANENLLAERSNNVEGGITFAHKRSFLRTSAFWTAIDRPVANVTLTTTPTLIARQRQNAGTTRSTGFEIEGETQFSSFALSAGYLFAHSTVTRFPANPALIGQRVPQVAKHQGTLQLQYARAKWTAAMQSRFSGEQFDDDLNQFRLEPYAQFDIHLSHRLSEKLKIYTAVENIFNSGYSVGRTPIRTTTSPTNFRLGLRWN